MSDRISIRFNGKLLALRMEDANISQIDRMAAAKGWSRSEWMRNAMLVQLAIDLADVQEFDLTDWETVEPDVSHETIEEPVSQEPAPPPEDQRPNRWG